MSRLREALADGARIAVILCALFAAATAWFCSCMPEPAHALTRAATPATLASVDATVQPGDVVHLAAGTYVGAPNPTADGVTYLGNLADPASVRLGARLVLNRSRIVVRGVTVPTGVSFDLRAANDSLTDSKVGSDVMFREADSCGIARCTGDVSRIWFVSRNESWAADSLIPGAAVLSPGVIDCSWTVTGSGNNHIIRLSGVQNLLWLRTRLVGQSSSTSGNTLRKIFYSNGSRWQDCYFNFENVCATTCDESGGFVIRDKSQDHWFVRDTLILRGHRSDGWLTASGNAPNSETNANNHFIQCVYRNETPGSIYYQNNMVGGEIRDCTIVQRGAFALSGVGSASRGYFLPATIEGTTFVNLDGGPAFQIWDGGPFAATLRMRHNTFVTTGTIPAFISAEMVAGKLDSDSSLYVSPGPAASAVRFYRSCCGYTLSAVGTGSAWTAVSGQDAHSRFTNEIPIDRQAPAPPSGLSLRVAP